MKGLVINKQLYYFKVGFSTHVSFQLLILTTVIIISLFWSFLLATPILNAVVGFVFFFHTDFKARLEKFNVSGLGLNIEI